MDPETGHAPLGLENTPSLFPEGPLVFAVRLSVTVRLHPCLSAVRGGFVLTIHSDLLCPEIISARFILKSATVFNANCQVSEHE